MVPVYKVARTRAQGVVNHIVVHVESCGCKYANGRGIVLVEGTGLHVTGSDVINGSNAVVDQRETGIIIIVPAILTSIHKFHIGETSIT